YLGVLLYDADGIEQAAATPHEHDLYRKQLELFLDPNDPKVIEAARRDRVPEAWLESARRSPVYRMAIDWKIAFPLHPEYRTLPMVWYVPPLSPIQNAVEAGHVGFTDELPDIRSLRIPLRYLANLLTAGDEGPIVMALNRMMAMRIFMRDRHVEQRQNDAVLGQAGLTLAQVEDMYKTLAIANYEDRFVIPTTHREYAEDAFGLRGGCGFSFGNGCSDGASKASLFDQRPVPVQRKKVEA
ncbi:MAG: nitrate reductase subunit beta, partial [Reyranellales bacterium]